jgi:hypothetical protein
MKIWKFPNNGAYNLKTLRLPPTVRLPPVEKHCSVQFRPKEKKWSECKSDHLSPPDTMVLKNDFHTWKRILLYFNKFSVPKLE